MAKLRASCQAQKGEASRISDSEVTIKAQTRRTLLIGVLRADGSGYFKIQRANYSRAYNFIHEGKPL